jgi:predicted RNA polymerase sigma factor
MQEETEAFTAAINKLAGGLRIAVVLRELGELSIADTASCMGLSVGAVKARVFQGRRKLRTRGGKVTLRGPVRSEEEKTSLEAKAVAVAGQENLTNQLEIVPSN